MNGWYSALRPPPQSKILGTPLRRGAHDNRLVVGAVDHIPTHPIPLSLLAPTHALQIMRVTSCIHE